jgi:RNA polymerase sigma factor (sigma-70 family)
VKVEPAATPEPIEEIRERILASAASRMSRSDAEDLAQDVVTILLVKYADVKDPADLLRLAYDILFKLRIGWYRRRIRRGEDTAESVDDVPLADRADDPETALLRKEFAERVGKAIRSLGEPCRTILRLKLEGQDTDYIMKAIRAGTKNALFIRLKRCRDLLDEKLGGIAGRRPQ